MHRRILGSIALLLATSIGCEALAEVPPSLLAARRAKSDAALSLLVYQHINQLFETEPVKAGPNVWALEHSPLSLQEFTYTYNGKAYAWADFPERTKANAVIVLKDGKIVSEVYRNGSGPDTRFIAYSMSKSVTSVLTGLAVADGLIKVDDQVVAHIPELKGTAYDGVTIRNLLMMRSGVDWSEAYAPGTELDKVRDGSTNQAIQYYEDYAFKATRATEPGSKFNYSTLDAGVLGWALERAVKRPIPEYMSDRLWKSAGMEFDGYWMKEGPEGKQRPWFGAGFNSTLRDFARFGQLMVDGGKARNRQVVPSSWVDQSTSNTDHSNYMWLWWPIAGVEGGFAGRGTYGQALFADRTNNTVIVAFSYWPANADNAQISEEQASVFKQVSEALRVSR
ncbi:serine hydrolase domain-containing protein [Bradyrhizobium manausense]